MNKALAVGVGLLVLALLLLFSTTYTVNFNEVAIRRTFGQADESSVVRTPGLHFRLPIFIDKVDKLDARLQLVESPRKEITTSDGIQVVAKGFLLWQVDTDGSGPLDFYKNYESIGEARKALIGQFQTALDGALSEYAFGDLLGTESKLAEAEEAVRTELARSGGNGIRPVSVGISQLMFPSRTTSAVLTRMQATQSKLAESERSKGTARAHAIKSEANTQADKILAFATQRAEEIKALGEEQAARYLREMSADEDLAIFLVWLDTIVQALGDNTTIVLPTQIEPWHLMNPADVTIRDSIPYPKSPDRLARLEAEAAAAPPPVTPGGDTPGGEESDSDG